MARQPKTPDPVYDELELLVEEALEKLANHVADMKYTDQPADHSDPRIKKINQSLYYMKMKINRNFTADRDKEDGDGEEVVLFIKDKKTNPWRKQTEDIEPDVIEMKAVL